MRTKNIGKADDSGVIVTTKSHFGVGYTPTTTGPPTSTTKATTEAKSTDNTPRNTTTFVTTTTTAAGKWTMDPEVTTTKRHLTETAEESVADKTAYSVQALLLHYYLLDYPSWQW